ncbi:MAG: GntR family transcriptional regulator [Anaerolineae bacterium]|nr:GntR family transcriptional regulator [Anaerolineae bacterium]
MNKYFLEIQKLIQSGEFKAGEALPSTEDLAKRFSASPAEIEEAISELIYEGELERQRPQPLPTVQVPTRKLWGTLGGSHSITKEAKKRGEEPGVEIINWKLVDAWPSIQKRLALDPGDQVQIMERLRSVNGMPVAIEISYFPAKFYPGITPDLFTEEGSGQSSFAVMEQKFGLKSDKAFDEVTVVCLEKREADYLKVAQGTPVLQRFRVTLSDKGIPIKASRAVWLFRAAYQMAV